MKVLPKYLAELIGTFALALVVSFSLAGVSVLSTALLAALTLGLFVYTVGHISGAHLNPAITLGALSIKKIALQDAVGYWIAQFLGGYLAFAFSDWVFGGAGTDLVADNASRTGLGEALGLAFFAFGVAAVLHGRVPKDLTGAVVGGSLLLGIALAYPMSSALINPAVALAVGSLTPVYLIGPLLGGIVGMWAFKLLSERK